MLNDLHEQRLEVMGQHEALKADLNRLRSQYQVGMNIHRLSGSLSARLIEFLRA